MNLVRHARRELIMGCLRRCVACFELWKTITIRGFDASRCPPPLPKRVSCPAQGDERSEDAQQFLDPACNSHDLHSPDLCQRGPFGPGSTRCAPRAPTGLGPSGDDPCRLQAARATLRASLARSSPGVMTARVAGPIDRMAAANHFSGDVLSVHKARCHNPVVARWIGSAVAD